MNQNFALDQQLFTTDKHEVVSDSVSAYLFLSLITFGLYELYWTYKIWVHYKEKEALDIMPVGRAIFSVFFNYGLFEKIKSNARMESVQVSYSSGMLFVVWLVLNLLSKLPDPFWLVSFLSMFVFVPIIQTFHNAIEASDEYHLTIREGFSTGQIIAIILGVILWCLVLAGYLLPDDTDMMYDSY